VVIKRVLALVAVYLNKIQMLIVLLYQPIHRITHTKITSHYTGLKNA